MKALIGLLLAFAIGVFCRYAGIPVPAPPVLEGAILVLAMTVGYMIANRLSQKKSTTKHLCGGPTGKPHSEKEQD
jgi:XapX domain-containing protein